jgi:hypothetical protein
MAEAPLPLRLVWAQSMVLVSTTHHPTQHFILLEENLPKPRNPYCGPTDQPTNQLLAEKLKYSRDRARWHQCPTNNLLEVWQNLAIFGGRPIGAAVEALLTIVVSLQSSVSLIVVFL